MPNFFYPLSFIFHHLLIQNKRKKMLNLLHILENLFLKGINILLCSSKDDLQYLNTQKIGYWAQCLPPCLIVAKFGSLSKKGLRERDSLRMSGDPTQINVNKNILWFNKKTR